MEGVRLEGERLDDPAGLFGHFDLRGVGGGGVLGEGGRAAQGGLGRGAGLVARRRGGRLGAGLVGHLDGGGDRRTRLREDVKLTSSRSDMADTGKPFPGVTVFFCRRNPGKVPP